VPKNNHKKQQKTSPSEGAGARRVLFTIETVVLKARQPLLRIKP
jgi:hypothetical protein